MLKFEWNALRPGDPVIVHDLESSDLTLLPGVVMTVDTRAGRMLVNGVRIRVDGSDGVTRLLWPAYMAVHLEPLDPTEPCWRCEEMATNLERPAVSLDEPAADARRPGRGGAGPPLTAPLWPIAEDSAVHVDVLVDHPVAAEPLRLRRSGCVGGRACRHVRRRQQPRRHRRRRSRWRHRR